MELRKATHALHSGRAVCTGDLPIEFYNAMAEEAGWALQVFLDLCNTCLAHQSVPKEWLQARVAMMFKKGDPASCENYRPISLVNTAYKIFASLLKQRLLDADIDSKLWGSQFGFRKKRSTEDAIYVARRRIELACAQRSGQISMLALDWSKAFDSVNVTSMLDASRRFGIPSSIVSLIGNMLRGRQFFVEDCGSQSHVRAQRSGISQGCTLSPLPFIVVMSVLMHDAVDLL